MNVLDRIDALMENGYSEEEAGYIVDVERNYEDYYDTGFDESYERLLTITEDEL